MPTPERRRELISAAILADRASVLGAFMASLTTDEEAFLGEWSYMMSAKYAARLTSALIAADKAALTKLVKEIFIETGLPPPEDDNAVSLGA